MTKDEDLRVQAATQELVAAVGAAHMRCASLAAELASVRAELAALKEKPDLKVVPNEGA